MSTRFRKFFPFFLIAALAASGGLLYKKWSYRKTDGFALSGIQFEIPFEDKWEIAPLPIEEETKLHRILDSNFYYLAKGARSYAFLSEDGQYVLKFFKFRYHVPHWTLRYLPPVQPFEYFRQKKAVKVSLDTVLSGYKNAYEHDPEGTGLIFVHLNGNDIKLPEITVHDKQGKAHSIDLSKTRFVLQRRVEELSFLLDRLLKDHDVALATRRINQTLDLYLSHYKKGLYDLGTGFVRNNGFIGEMPVHFDVGKLTLDDRAKDPNFQREALRPLIKNLDKWLQDKHPDARDEIMKGVKNEG